MSWVPAERVLATVAAQKQVIGEQQGKIANALEYHAQERKKLEGERAQAIHDLGQAVLAKLDARSIAAAAQKVGLVGLPNEKIPERLEARRAWLVQRLADIRRDPRYAHRELLRHPRTGSLITEIAEAEEYRRPAAEVLDTCNEHPRFERLLEIGFGTAEHKAAWWRFSYWADRSAANELIARFPGKASFSEVLEEYQRANQTVASYDAELERLRGEVAGGEALEREHDTLVFEHDNLDAQGLEHTRTRLVQHMMSSDVSLMSQRLAPSSALRLLFLRASGLSSKIAYLDGIQQTNIAELQKDLDAQKQKLEAVAARTKKRWAPMPADKFAKLAEDRRPKYEKRWQRFGKTYTQVHSFDRWDRGSRFDDLLWWDVMTRGRYDGSYLPEVQMFHSTHPDYHFDADRLRGRAPEHRAESHHTQSHYDTGGGFDVAAPDVSSEPDDSDAAASSIEADTDDNAADDALGSDAS
jgi:hypothetical protein